MPDRPNLADPSVEPSDEDLQGLAARAVADARGENERGMQRVLDEIERERKKVLRELAAYQESRGGK